MTIYLSELFRNVEKDKGKTFNFLIDKGILNYKEVFDNLLSYGSSYNLLLLAAYIDKVSAEDKIIIAKELIRRRDFPAITSMAKNIREAPITMLTDAIITSDNACFI